MKAKERNVNSGGPEGSGATARREKTSEGRGKIPKGRKRGVRTTASRGKKETTRSEGRSAKEH